MREDLLTREQAAEYLGLAEGTLSVWASRPNGNNLPFVKVGRLVRYRKNDLDEFIARGIKGNKQC